MRKGSSENLTVTGHIVDNRERFCNWPNNVQIDGDLDGMYGYKCCFWLQRAGSSEGPWSCRHIKKKAGHWLQKSKYFITLDLFTLQLDTLRNPFETTSHRGWWWGWRIMAEKQRKNKRGLNYFILPWWCVMSEPADTAWEEKKELIKFWG